MIQDTFFTLNVDIEFNNATLCNVEMCTHLMALCTILYNTAHKFCLPFMSDFANIRNYFIFIIFMFYSIMFI